MIQVQIRIDFNKKNIEQKTNAHFAVEVLEREDANDLERKLAKVIEDVFREYFQLLTKFPGVEVKQFKDIGRQEEGNL